MPFSPKRPCRYPGCAGFCEAGKVYCPAHNQELDRERFRLPASQRGYGAKWRVARKRYLQQHPLCVECLAEHRIEPATVVDHIKPHRGDPVLFWDEGNWQGLCKIHHDKKTGSGL